MRLHASIARGMGSVPGWGSSSYHIVCGKKKKSERNTYGIPPMYQVPFQELAI